MQLAHALVSSNAWQGYETTPVCQDQNTLRIHTNYYLAIHPQRTLNLQKNCFNCFENYNSLRGSHITP